MSLINWRVELKLKWSKYCVLDAAGVDNSNANSNNYILTLKHSQLHVPIVILSLKTIKKYQNILANDLKNQCIGINIKQTVRIKIRLISIDVFLNQTL